MISEQQKPFDDAPPSHEFDDDNINNDDDEPRRSTSTDSSKTVEEEPVDWFHGDPDYEDDSINDNVNDLNSPALKQWIRKKKPISTSKTEKVKQNLTVISAVAAGTTVSLVKFVSAFITGSVAMLAEGVHSLVDAINDSLLLVGTAKSKKPADVEHPFGYGKLLFFYTFVVSIAIFLLGGCFTIYQGAMSLLSAEHTIENPIVNYIVLTLGIIIESVSLKIAFTAVNKDRGEKSIARYIRESKNPTNFTVLLEDSAAVLGMIVAMVGVFLTDVGGLHWADGAASIVIGIIMCIIAAILLRETRSLLIGEGLTKDEINDVVFIVESDPAVIKCGRVLSMYLSPTEMLLTLDVTFDDELDEGDVLQATDRIEQLIIDDYPQATSIFIEVESLNHVYRQRKDRKDAFEALEDEEEPSLLDKIVDAVIDDD